MATARMHRLGLLRTTFLHKHGAPVPPLMADQLHVGPAGASSRLYSNVLTDPPVAHVRHTKHPTINTDSRSSLVRKRIAEIRANSTPNRPICMRCGDKGHIAKTCRNKQLCFACNRLGHRATDCRQKPQSRPVTSLNPRSTTSKPQVVRQRHPSPSPMSIKPPLVVLEATPRSLAIENNLAMSFVLDDIAAWGPAKVEGVLCTKFNKHRWVASVFDEYKYLIKAPNPAWLESVASRATSILAMFSFRSLPGTKASVKAHRYNLCG